jgi:hypothetical protein
MKQVVLALLGLLALTACSNKRTACVYELPHGYTGWVLIEYYRADAPPIRKVNGKLLFQIPSSGKLATSSALEYGWAKDEYFDVGQVRTELKQTFWGGGGRIWGEANGHTDGTGQRTRIYEFFFVGTENAFKNVKVGAPIPN